MRTLQTLLNLGAIAFALTSTIALTGCSPESPFLRTPPEQVEKVTVDGDQLSVEYAPALDILFVIDNSASMEEEQKKLSQNIDRFVDAFAQNNVLDVNIGVVSVFDSGRFRSYPSPQDPTYLKDKALYDEYFNANGETIKPGAPNRYEIDTRYSHFESLGDNQQVLPVGQLRAPKDPANPKNALPLGRRFLKPEDPNFLESLRATLKLGALSAANGAPVFEETFSAITQALSKKSLADKNKGFLRPDALLAVVVITDADDASVDLTARSVRDYLVSLKGGRRELISAFGALAPPNDKSCPPDPSAEGIYNTYILDLIRYLNGEDFSICSDDYGAQLSQFGQGLRDKVLRKVIALPKVPAAGTLRVTYGSQEIPQDAQKGWTLNTSRNEVIINGGVELKKEDGAKIQVSYDALMVKNARFGTLNPYGDSEASDPATGEGKINIQVDGQPAPEPTPAQ